VHSSYDDGAPLRREFDLVCLRGCVVAQDLLEPMFPDGRLEESR
jgi:hypothetical protein